MKKDISAFEVKDGLVNLTKMCQHSGTNKQVKDWLRLKATASFVDAYAEEHKCSSEDVIKVIKGGNGEQGTWSNRLVALELARWISPAFGLFANSKLDELFRTGHVSLSGNTNTVSVSQLLQMNVNVIGQLQAQLEEKQKKVAELAKRDLEVTTQKEFKWKKEVIQRDRGNTINYYVNLYFKRGVSFSRAHQDAKQAYYNATGISLPHYAKHMSMDQKRDYLDWLSRYEVVELTKRLLENTFDS